MADDNNEYGNGSMTDQDWQDMWGALKWGTVLFLLSVVACGGLLGLLMWWLTKIGAVRFVDGNQC